MKNIQNGTIQLNQTFKHVFNLYFDKPLGPGNLLFSVGLSKKTYYRKTSQGIWEKVPIGIGISVTAQVEKQD